MSLIIHYVWGHRHCPEKERTLEGRLIKTMRLTEIVGVEICASNKGLDKRGKKQD